MNILIIGAGKLGLPLARILHEKGHQVTTLSRSEKFIHPDIRHLCADVHQLSKDTLSDYALVYVILSPSERSLAGYQSTYVHSILPIVQSLNTQKLQRLIYVSSTQVYGQNQGQTVDDSAAPAPASQEGKILFAAELLWQAQLGEKVSIVRPSGLIDGDIFENFAGHFARLAKTLEADSAQFSEDYWLNLAYRRTVIDVLAKLGESKTIKLSYIVSDMTILRHQFYNRLRLAQGLDAIAVPDNLPTTGKRLIASSLD